MAVDSKARAYFSPPPSAVWRWSADGDGLEDLSGRTIAYGQEVLQYLKRLQPQGLPVFDSLVLVMMGFRFKWKSDIDHSYVARRVCREPKVSLYEQELLTALGKITEIPLELRKTPAHREALLGLVCLKRSMVRVSPSAAIFLIERFAAGIPADELPELPPAALPMAERIKQWRALTDGLQRVSAEAITNFTRTGLEQLPAKETVGNILTGLLEAKAEEEAEPPAPLTVQELLEELRQDDQYLTFVKLVRNLLAMVHLPKSLAQEEELPLGGVSDLTNRGPLDRLLLSELAYDDATLTTRIALNEALYLRRETPPSNPRQRRVVLLDCGLRMWGVPRVYGTAVALALLAAQQRSPSGRGSTPSNSLEFWRAAGKRLAPVDFTTKEGLLELLAALQPEMHFAEALPDLTEHAGSPDVERVFITCAETWQDAVVQAALREQDLRDCYVFLVSRDGRLELRRISAAGSKTLRTVQQSLEGLLERPEQAATPEPLVRPEVGTRVPAFYLASPSPLRIPESVDWARSWYWEGTGNFSLTPNGDLLLWEERKGTLLGPRLIGSGLPPGSIAWASVRWPGTPWGYVALRDADSGLVKILSLVEREGDWSCKKLIEFNAKSESISFHEHQDLIFVVNYTNGRQVSEYLKSNGQMCSNWVLPEDAVPLFLGRYFLHWANRSFHVLGQGTSLREFPVPSELTGNPQNAYVRIAFDGATGFVLVTINGRYWSQEQWKRLSFEPELLTLSSDGQRVLCQQDDNQERKFAIFTAGKDDPELFTNLAWAQLKLNQPGAHCVCDREMIRSVSGLRIANGKLHLVKRLRQVQALELRGDLSLRKAKSATANTFRFEPANVPPEHAHRNLKWVRWSDGSTIWLDPRGLLHLQSSKREIPEATIVLSTDEQSSGWCSDGRTWGTSYFLGLQAKPVSPGAIYKEVIEPFLQALPLQ